MAPKRVVAAQSFYFPVTCKCPECGAVSTYRITVPARGAAVMSGSPFGRKERAKAEARKNLLGSMAYHVRALYDECEKEPYKIAQYLSGTCPECGTLLPWCALRASEPARSGQSGDPAGAKPRRGLFSRKQAAPEPVEWKYREIIGSVDPDCLPKPAVTKEEMLRAYGLEGAAEAPGPDDIRMHT